MFIVEATGIIFAGKALEGALNLYSEILRAYSHILDLVKNVFQGPTICHFSFYVSDAKAARVFGLGLH
jgi:hypothetical protein